MLGKFSGMTTRQSLTASSLLTTALVLAVAVVVAVVAAGGTFALWHTEQAVPGGVITTGSAELAVTGATEMSLGQLYPGQTTTGEVTVTNTGTVPLGLRVDAVTTRAVTAGGAAQAFAEAMSVSLWAKTATGCPATTPAGAWTGVIGAPGKDLGLKVNPGSAQTLCLTVTLAPTAPSAAQGATVPLSLVVGGVQQ
jgi:hypothetical protein